jgi:hypothetical protein
MSTRTRNELINEILENIGVLAAGQTANVEDTTRVQELLPSVQPMLMAMEIGYIPDFDAIPEHSFIPLAAICAYICRIKFGVSGDDEAALEKLFSQGVTALKVIYRGKPTYAPLQTDYI